MTLNVNHLVKRLLALLVARPLRLLRPITGQFQRLSAYVQLASRISGPLDPSVIILGDIEIEGTGKVSFGKNLRLYSGLFLETRGSAKIEIGDDVVISRGTHIVAHSGIKIGSGTMIGEYSSIRDGNHRRDSATGSIRETGHDTAPISIGNRVWIGRGAMILPGITIGDGATVGANAVVTRNVPAGVLVAGVPAKIIPKKVASAE